MSDAGAERPFFTRIESLRGLGALAVAGFHMSGWTVNGMGLLSPELWPGIAGWQAAIGKFHFAMFSGHAALMMFFVISGCVLQVSLQYGPQDTVAATMRFAVARVFRIYPIVIVGTVIAAVAGTLLGTAPPATTSSLVRNMLLIDATFNETLWALQLEVLMAPCIFLFYFVGRRCGPWPVLAAVLLTTALSFTKKWTFWPPLSHDFFSFILGMLIPSLGAQWARALSRRTAQIAFFLCALMLIFAGQFLGFYAQSATVLEAYAAAALISIVTYRNDLMGVRFLDAWPFRRLGLASGSYYVLHMPLLPFAVVIADLVVPASWSQTLPLPVGLGVILVSLALFAPIAFVSFQLIEAPGIACGRWMIRRLAGLRPVREAPPTPAV
jgi:peptidoglycan/LPS O-acetylase OafA/YrhL